MGRFMNWIQEITHRSSQRQLRTERLEEITKTRKEINETSSAIKHKVQEYQAKDDPLQALMHTLRQTRGH